MPFMIEVAAVLAAAVEDWEDFSIILTLLLVNASIGSGAPPLNPQRRTTHDIVALAYRNAC
jgi:hypothetical protein